MRLRQRLWPARAYSITLRSSSMGLKASAPLSRMSRCIVSETIAIGRRSCGCGFRQFDSRRSRPSPLPSCAVKATYPPVRRRSNRSMVANMVVAHIHVSALSVMLARHVGGGSEHGSVQYATVMPAPSIGMSSGAQYPGVPPRPVALPSILTAASPKSQTRQCRRLKRGTRLSPRRRTRMLLGFMSRCSVPTLCMCSRAHATCKPIIWCTRRRSSEGSALASLDDPSQSVTEASSIKGMKSMFGPAVKSSGRMCGWLSTLSQSDRSADLKLLPR
mmetsp:Transcript_53952/g.79105  ORF Transcript_53952/g.79105 Transcript_53952/m.79105 type:complete len:274 (-) Transcript_53952:121-942(-)